KINLIRLLRKVPEFSELTGIDSDDADLRKVLFEEAMAQADCDMSYADDVEPWIGDRAAFAAVPGGDTPTPAVALQATDVEAAETAIGKVAECAGGEAGVAAVDDYVIIAEEQDAADEIAADAKESSLSENSEFADDMDALGEQGVASFWLGSDMFNKYAERSEE